MEEFKKRLLEEYNQLSDRITKLNIALHSDNFESKVGETQYELMMNQILAMTNYAMILQSRLSDLGIN